MLLLLIAILMSPCYAWNIKDCDPVRVSVQDSTFSLVWQAPDAKRNIENCMGLPSAALVGSRGIRLSSLPRGYRYASCRFSRPDEFFLRFYFRLDSVGPLPGAADTNKLLSPPYRFFFTSIKFNDGSGGESPAFLSGYLKFPEKRGEKIRLFLVAVRNQMRLDSLNWSIDEDSTYRLDLHFGTKTRATQTIEVWSNGQKCGDMEVPHFPDACSEAELVVSDGVSGIRLPWIVSVDEFQVSDHVLRKTLPIPTLPLVTVRHDTAVLSINGIVPVQAVKLVHWQVWQNDTLFPFMDRIETEPYRFFNQSIQLCPPNGKYSVRVALQDTMGNMGAWSPLAQFDYVHSSGPDITIQNLEICPTDKDNQHFRPDCWNNIQVTLQPPVQWSRIAYLLVYLRHESYTQGTPSNKGGQFHASSSYILNLSQPGRENVLFEKQQEGGWQSIRVNSSSPGLYSKAFPDGVRIDKEKGIISLSFKFLKDARLGSWQVVANMVYQDERSTMEFPVEARSNLVMKRILLEKKKETSSDRWNKRQWGFILPIVMFLLGLAVFLLRGRKRNVTSARSIFEPEKLRILEDCITRQIGKDIDLEGLSNASGIGQTQILNILSQNQLTLLRLTSRIRMDHAKQQLLNSDLSVAEIGFAIGMEPDNFSKLFKKSTGLSPRMFREQGKKA